MASIIPSSGRVSVAAPEFRSRLAERLMAGAVNAPPPVRTQGEAVFNGINRFAQMMMAKRLMGEEQERKQGVSDTMVQAVRASKPWIAPDDVQGPTGDIVVKAGEPAPGTGGMEGMAAALANHPDTAPMAFQMQMQRMTQEQTLRDAMAKARGVKELDLKYDPQIAGATEAAKTPALVDRTTQTEAAQTPILADRAAKVAEAELPYKTAATRVQQLTPQEVQAAGLPPGTVAQQDASGRISVVSRPDKPTGTDRRVTMLTEGGVPEDIAKGIVGGRYTVSRDPLTSVAQVVDKATGKLVFHGSAPQQTTEAPQAGNRRTLWGMVDGITGAVPGLQETAQGVAGQLGVNVAPEALLENRQTFRNAKNDLVRALSINPKFPVAEIQRLQKEINIEPGAFTDERTLRSRMRAVDDYLRGRVERERKTAQDPSLPADSRKNAATAAKDIENFLSVMGVPTRAAAQSGPQPGAVEDGYRFKGGDPADPKSWEQVR